MKLLRPIMIWLGGLALLAATAIDTVSVIGRQMGFPLHGSLELIQPAVLVAGGLALIASTVARQHARVRLMIDRLGHRRGAFERLNDLLTGAFFLCLLIGSVWIAADLWNSNEISETVGVPWRWLRLFANLCLAAVVLLALRQAVKGDRG